ncbi:MAG: hypothetical protein WC421_00310 [Elusimicrobiales bacterium]
MRVHLTAFSCVLAALPAMGARCLAQDVFGGDIMLSTSAGVSAGQIYRQEIGRDPFMPVSVSSGPASSATQEILRAASSEPVEFDPRNLELSGIMTAPDGRVAMLYDKLSGLPYYLSKGRLYDRKDKPVSGISGVIQDRQVTLFSGGSEIVTTALSADFPYTRSARGAKLSGGADKEQPR